MQRVFWRSSLQKPVGEGRDIVRVTEGFPEEAESAARLEKSAEEKGRGEPVPARGSGLAAATGALQGCSPGVLSRGDASVPVGHLF